MEKENDPRDIQHEEMLNYSRQNMLDSLQLFFSHTKYSLTLLTTILAGSLAVTAFSFDKLLQDKPDASKLALVLAAVFLILMGPVSYITHRLIGRYYRLYVSFYVYAARLHEKYSSTEHPWFADLKSRLGDPKNHSENLYDDSAVRRFLDDEVANFKNGGRNSWYFYRWLIFFLGAFGTIAGSFVLGWLLLYQ